MDDLTTNDLIDVIPLDNSTKQIAQEIVNEQDLDKVKNLTHLFNLNQAKKNVLRVLKLNQLLDHVSDQMIERFEKTPDNFSNADLLNYMNITQSAIDRANKSLNLVDETPTIQVNTQVNINNASGTELLDRESKARVADAIKGILSRINTMNNPELQEVVEVVEDKNTTVYNNEHIVLNEEEEDD